MRLSWNEIRARAAAFAREWADASYEKGETQSFYNDFFAVFGVKRRAVARYEERVKKLDDKTGFIDLFWPGVLIVEQKSEGRDLDKAYSQAGEYLDNLKPSEEPRYVLVSDFQTFRLRDLSEREETSFALTDLPDHVERFGFVIGVERRSFEDQDPVNVEAAELVGALHDRLEDQGGLTGEELERFLVRIVFCLFADDTGVFSPRDSFLNYLLERTSEDGSDVGAKLTELFQTLNKHENKRPKGLDETLNQFPYINGDLFSGGLSIPAFDAPMRGALIAASEFDWTPISPAIFGSMFQFVMDPEKRRGVGAHYTSEKNILKVIGPLFMDELRAEFERAVALKRGRRQALERLHDRLASMTFFDPACGCGNFLIIAYREVRRLELDILKQLHEGTQLDLDAGSFARVTVDQFHGIEVLEFPVEVARASMWMMDHILNIELSLAFGQNYARIPLRAAPNVVHADALLKDWNEVLPAKDCNVVLGNPPFRGHQYRSPDQRTGMHYVWGRSKQLNRLDYVSCWFKKAVDYAQANQNIHIGFVATSSISQGEQASILWPFLFEAGVHIEFAHRSFKWDNDAPGGAAVHCVIVGLAFGEPPRERQLFDYKKATSEPVLAKVDRINGYLVDGPDVVIPARTKAPTGMPKMAKGSQPTDGARLKKAGGGYIKRSNLVLKPEDRDAFLAADPGAEKWLRPFWGTDELISSLDRWCLWLKDADPKEVRRSAAVQERLARVREGRLQSPTPSVQDFAKYPTLFTQDRQPDQRYVAVPEVSSEEREYIPIAYLEPNVIASNKLQIVPGGEPWLFAILTSAMHMGWMRTVTGRLESRYSYAPTVYNLFPWPELTDAKRGRLDERARAILDARAAHPDATLEELYDPNAMPPNLRRAHAANDKMVDKLYRRKAFESERERVAFLFELYEERSAPLAKRSALKPRR